MKKSRIRFEKIFCTIWFLKFPKYKLTFFAGEFPFQGPVKPCNSASSPSHAWLFFFRDLPRFLPLRHFFPPTPPLLPRVSHPAHMVAPPIMWSEQRASGQFERFLGQEKKYLGHGLTLRDSRLRSKPLSHLSVKVLHCTGSLFCFHPAGKSLNHIPITIIRWPISRLRLGGGPVTYKAIGR